MRGSRRLFTYCSFLIFVLFVFLNGVNSEVYTVGDDERWDSGINYLKWSEKYNFSVGDVLVFKYTKGQHDAYEVTEATYKSCDVSSGVLARHESGNDQVKLTEMKKYRFICSINGHCLGGMRLIVDVKEANNTSSATHSTNSAPTPAALPPTPPPDSNKCIASNSSSLWIMCLIAYVIFLKLNY